MMLRAAAAILLATLAGALPATADSLTYRNDRFGTSITFPAELFTYTQEPPENGDGMTWKGPGGLGLVVFASNNALDFEPDSFLYWLLDNRSSDGEVTYSRTGKDWVVVSGFNGDMVFYERHEFGASGAIHSMQLTYPASSKADIDPLVGPIAKSLSGP